MIDKLLDELLELLSEEELIRLQRRADLAGRLTLSTIFHFEITKRQEKTDVNPPHNS